MWVDRDLSWLEFNRRVLAEALDDRTPLLERAKFLAIFTSNLDEFFMKRIAVLREHTHAGAPAAARRDSPSACCPCCSSRRTSSSAGWSRSCRGTASTCALGRAERRRSSGRPGTYFDAQVSPALTPLVIHPAQPFPFFSNLSLSLAFLLHDDRTRRIG